MVLAKTLFFVCDQFAQFPHRDRTMFTHAFDMERETWKSWNTDPVVPEESPVLQVDRSGSRELGAAESRRESGP